jgi:hypothetical protein
MSWISAVSAKLGEGGSLHPFSQVCELGCGGTHPGVLGGLVVLLRESVHLSWTFWRSMQLPLWAPSLSFPRGREKLVAEGTGARRPGPGLRGTEVSVGVCRGRSFPGQTRLGARRSSPPSASGGGVLRSGLHNDHHPNALSRALPAVLRPHLPPHAFSWPDFVPNHP